MRACSAWPGVLCPLRRSSHMCAAAPASPDLTPSAHPTPLAVITDCLQGELEVVTLAGSGKAREAQEDAVDRVPFLMLGALCAAALAAL